MAAKIVANGRTHVFRNNGEIGQNCDGQFGVIPVNAALEHANTRDAGDACIEHVKQPEIALLLIQSLCTVPRTREKSRP